MSMYLNNQYALFTRCPFCMVTSQLPLSIYLPWSSMTHAPFLLLVLYFPTFSETFPFVQLFMVQPESSAWGCTHLPLPTLNQSSFSCPILKKKQKNIRSATTLKPLIDEVNGIDHGYSTMWPWKNLRSWSWYSFSCSLTRQTHPIIVSDNVKLLCKALPDPAHPWIH